MKDSIKDKYYIKRGSSISIDTVAIGAIRAFEDEFGHLWGIHLKEEELTPGHLAFKRKWIQVRKEILEQAESSKKIYSKNIDKFNVTRKRVFIDFNNED